jgi:hypothetical protein
MSHVTLPIMSVLWPTHSRRGAALNALIALVVVAAVLLVRTIDGDPSTPVPARSSVVPAQTASAAGTRPDRGPDESRVAVAVSGR